MLTYLAFECLIHLFTFSFGFVFDTDWTHVLHSFSLLEQECEFCLSCQLLFIVNHHHHHQYRHDNDKTNSNIDICVASCLSLKTFYSKKILLKFC